MNYLRPSEKLSEDQVQSGLSFIVKEGLAGEVMVNLTGGTFLVSMAIFMGATNFQIGLLASLPIFTNVFQLISLWLVRKYNNRRAIAVVSSFVARFALLIVGLLPFLFEKKGLNVGALIFLLSFHYIFGSIASASWNSWMKDLVPGNMLGRYFSYRTRMVQIISVTSNLLVALFIDFMKSQHPQALSKTYFIMFLLGGAVGMLGVYLLSRAPEPKALNLEKERILNMFSKPLKDKNFRKLVVFNSVWAFSLDLAIPFFSVFMMRTIGLPLSIIMAFTIIGQLSSILSVKFWGRYSDKYSNKTIIKISAPLYVLSIIAMAFTALPSAKVYSIAMIILINIVSGISTAGINLAIGNIGMKLAPKEDAMAYMSVRNIVVSFIAALAPLVGGLLADFFASHQLSWEIVWQGAKGPTVIHLFDLHGLNFFFVIGGVLAILSLQLLSPVKESGEVTKGTVVSYMRRGLRTQMRKSVPYKSLRSYRPGSISLSLLRQMSAMF